MDHFDLLVIGSGPAGYTAAIRALDFSKNVCIVEATHLGGAGVMNGALTSKTMWELSHDYSVAASVDRGAAGPQASAFIVSIAHLINQGDSLSEVMRVVHPHPSITEGIQECLRILKGKSIFKPDSFPDLIKVWEWEPSK